MKHQQHTEDQVPRNQLHNREKFTKDEQGQTFFDFTVGITLFLFVVLFTVTFIPGLIDPFEPSPNASTVLADRGADHLTQNVMRADGEGPYVLDEDCTTALFDGDATSACDVDDDELRAIVGMSERSNAHAHITDRQGNTVELDGVELEYGDDVETTSTGDVYSSTRVVTINGDRYELKYRVW